MLHALLSETRKAIPSKSAANGTMPKVGSDLLNSQFTTAVEAQELRPHRFMITDTQTTALVDLPSRRFQDWAPGPIRSDYAAPGLVADL